MRKWEELPEDMRNEKIRRYYDTLIHHKFEITVKRGFDILASLALLLVLSPLFVVLGILIKLDSEGPILYKQIRVTTYGKKFRIWKFRTMVSNADKIGTQVTTSCDSRITSIGRILRKVRLDELPQLFNILRGEMTFVGTRPEVPKYTKHYTDEMKATWLLPAGVTSRTSIEYKDEERLLGNAEDADKIYIEQILPAKMKINLREIERFSLWRDICTMVRTVIAVMK